MADPKNPKQLLELIEALLEVYRLQKEVRKDDKFDFMDIPLIFASGPKLWTGFIGLDKIDNELLVIDGDGKAKIVALIKSFDIEDDEIEGLIEDLFVLITNMIELGAKVSNLFKSKKDKK